MSLYSSFASNVQLIHAWNLFVGESASAVGTYNTEIFVQWAIK